MKLNIFETANQQKTHPGIHRDQAQSEHLGSSEEGVTPRKRENITYSCQLQINSGFLQ